MNRVFNKTALQKNIFSERMKITKKQKLFMKNQTKIVWEIL